MRPRAASHPVSSLSSPRARRAPNPSPIEAVMNFLTEIVAFVVAIGVLVVVHEFGHYSVARMCGVKVLRFSVGFGTPLVRWVSKKTGVEWTIAALPLGGYVKMLDERETGTAPIPAELLPQAFNRKSVW